MKIGFAGFDLPEGKVKFQDAKVEGLERKFTPQKVTPFYAEFIKNDFLNCDAIFISQKSILDLLILDMTMPAGIDGTETYRRISEARPEQKAIIMSGFAESERVREAMALGAGAFLRKPVSMEKLARAVREELDRV